MCGLGSGDKQVWLFQSRFNATAGDVEVPFVALNAGERAPRLHSRYARGSAAHKGVTYRLGVGDMGQAPIHHAFGLLSGVFPHVIALADHAIPTPVDAAHGLLEVGPSQFTIGKVPRVLLVPDQPARGWPKSEIVSAKYDLPLTTASDEVNMRLRSWDRIPIAGTVVFDHPTFGRSDCTLRRNVDPIRRVRNARIKPAQRRKHLKAIAKDANNAVSEGFGAEGHAASHRSGRS